jgi:hypothetical protein
LVKKKKCSESLVLRGRRNMFIDGKMSEEFGDLAFTHFVWMALVVKQDVAANPIEIRLLRANGIMFHAQMPANAIE